MAGARVETIGMEAAATHERAWRDLGARALEPNVFAEPAFVLSAMRHLAKTTRLQLLVVWQDEPERLIGVAVIEFPRAFGRFGVARIWQSNQAGLAAILLDREAADQALDALVGWLAHARRVAGLLLPTLDAAGPAAAAVSALGFRGHLQWRELWKHSRAVLPAAPESLPGFEASLPKKRLKEWRRLLARLRDRGPVAFRIANDDVAVEQFLALEAKGWKGAQRTALGAQVSLAAFTRTMLADMARDGRLAIHLMELNGAVIAAALLLRANGRAFYWKTAYDESYAEFSPGVQLTLELSRAQQRDASIGATDSCAIEGHPMIDRLWPARLTLVDCVIATRPGRAPALALWQTGETARRRLKEIAKRLINPLRGRKRS
jgi:CelD/BcsL family acetyltransferase involved in cellulose biosynthesis